VCAVRAVDLEIADGEFMVLVGPSGCGKSTLLRMIAGLEEVTEGGVIIGDRDVTYDPPRDRNLAMVFQNYALYPHMTVRKNLGLGLKLHKVPKRDIAVKVAEVARMLGLEDLLERRPAQLSGGQRQRVAMGRALVRDPMAFLMDEPLSNLDAKLRVSMREELARLHQQIGTTTVYVTHDQVEAMTLGSRVAVMRDGVLQQCAPPDELYRRPANLFCATFIGSPQINVVEATVTGGVARFAGIEVPLAHRSVADGRYVLAVRPNCLRHGHDGMPAEGIRLEAEIDLVENLGSLRHAIFAIEADRLQAAGQVTGQAAGDPPDEASLLVRHDVRARWTAVLDDRHDVRPGERLELWIDPERVLLFDPDSGNRVD
jgi:multiple sugar transport system ATP-binding protein